MTISSATSSSAPTAASERRLTVAAATLLVCVSLLFQPARAADDVETRSLSELRRDLDAGKTTSVQLVEAFTRRIEAIDKGGPQLRAIIAVNPRAMAQARALDQEL